MGTNEQGYHLLWPDLPTFMKQVHCAPHHVSPVLPTLAPQSGC
ncbi:unnamed protein product [Musa acuminata subsp. malaccensis]|nr:unnamed protein product [Musa acuminata subsp. malaccensis]